MNDPSAPSPAAEISSASTKGVRSVVDSLSLNHSHCQQSTLEPLASRHPSSESTRMDAGQWPLRDDLTSTTMSQPSYSPVLTLASSTMSSQGGDRGTRSRPSDEFFPAHGRQLSRSHSVHRHPLRHHPTNSVTSESDKIGLAITHRPQPRLAISSLPHEEPVEDSSTAAASPQSTTPSSMQPKRSFRARLKRLLTASTRSERQHNDDEYVAVEPKHWSDL